jgi:hypothetical protein
LLLGFACIAGVHANTAIIVGYDGPPDATTCTLAQAINAANAHNFLDPELYGSLTPAGNCPGAGIGTNLIGISIPTITLTTIDNYWYGPNALPPIASNIFILPTTYFTTIRAVHTGDPTPTTANAFRLFYVSGGLSGLPAGALTLGDLVLQGGYAKGGDSGSGGGGAGMGGAIFNQGYLSLKYVSLIGNTARGGTATGGDVNGGGGMGQDGISDNGGGFGGALGANYGGAGGAGGSGVGSGGGFVGGSDGGTGSPDNGAPGGGKGGLGGQGDNGAAGDGGGGAKGFGLGAGFGGAFGIGGSFSGGGGGVGGGGARAGGGGGFGGGGGGAAISLSYFGSQGGFGGGNGVPSQGPSGFGGGYNGYDPTGGAGMGGAIFNHAGTVYLLNVTASSNAANGGANSCSSPTCSNASSLGAVLFNLNGSVTIDFSTLAGNTLSGNNAQGDSKGPEDGTVYSLAYGNKIQDGTASSATLTIHNSIVHGTQADGGLHSDVSVNVVNGVQTNASNLVYAGNNFVGKSYTVTGVTQAGTSPGTVDPLLGSLSLYFQTPVLPIGSNSPAYNAAPSCIEADGATTLFDDARATPRPYAGLCDVGAYEFDGDYIFADGADVKL